MGGLAIGSIVFICRAARTMVSSLTAVVDSSAALQLTETPHASDGPCALFDGHTMPIHEECRAPSYKPSHVADALQDLDALTAAVKSAARLRIPLPEGIQKVHTK